MPGTFAATFRRHAIPHLRNRCAVNSAMLGLRIWSWNEAYDDVLRLALDHGALSLNDAEFHKLEEWIASELLRRTDAVEAAARAR